MQFTFHILGLVHLPCSRNYMSCAFTQKNYKFAQMMLSLGHQVFYYGAEGSTIPCTEFIETHSLKDLRQTWGDGDNRFEIGYDWTSGDFRHDFNSKRTPVTLKFYHRCIEEINKRKEADHFLLCTQGAYHSPIADGVNLFLTCEPGIGYRGSVKTRYRAFESSYIQNFTYGSEAPYECINGSYYDRVIPNYFSEEDVEFSDQKEDYYLFIGRMIKRKGILTAALACEAIGTKLIIAGQGASVNKDGYLVPNEEPDFYLKPGTWEYVGYCDVNKRKKLMSKAIATFTPTEYLECFAGTHIESMLHGTPPITTNFGVFPGTIPDHLDGKVGFRCNTLQDFVDAAIAAKDVDHSAVREYGERFLTGNVKYEFNKWFHDLYQVYESAANKNLKGWHRLKNLTI
jgi:glycosyltransferase involved in cell wall biosynthesis